MDRERVAVVKMDDLRREERLRAVAAPRRAMVMAVMVNYNIVLALSPLIALMAKNLSYLIRDVILIPPI